MRPEEAHQLDDRLAYYIPNFAKTVDLSVTAVRETIKRGDLVASYPAKMKPLITREEGLRWLRSLPDEPQQAL